MVIYKIRFKRTKDSKWESGIKIETDEGADVYMNKFGNQKINIYL